MLLAEKVAVVTGSSQGIGQAIAIAFGQAGADVVVNYRNSQDEAESTAAEIRNSHRRAITVKADLTKYDETDALIAQTLAEFGRIDILVNNIGGADELPPGGFVDMPMEYWHNQLAKNLNGAVYCTQLVLQHMLPRKQGGKIINISSIHSAKVLNVKMLPYACAKAALNQFTRVLAVEMGPHNIQVNAIAPGLIVTPRTMKRYDSQWWEKTSGNIPLKRPGRADEIAALAVFLASEQANYVTGQIITADGGRLLI